MGSRVRVSWRIEKTVVSEWSPVETLIWISVNMAKRENGASVLSDVSEAIRFAVKRHVRGVAVTGGGR